MSEAEPTVTWQPDHEGLATTRGKDYAQQCLAWRRVNQPVPINNASLYAGNPMYYYCLTCGHLADVLPESHIGTPRTMCRECAALKQLDWLE